MSSPVTCAPRGRASHPRPENRCRCRLRIVDAEMKDVAHDGRTAEKFVVSAPGCRWDMSTIRRLRKLCEGGTFNGRHCTLDRARRRPDYRPEKGRDQTGGEWFHRSSGRKSCPNAKPARGQRSSAGDAQMGERPIATPSRPTPAASGDDAAGSKKHVKRGGGGGGPLCRQGA